MDDQQKSPEATRLSLPKSLERSLDPGEFETLLRDITLVENCVGHAEPDTKRTKTAHFNPRPARLTHIVSEFCPSPTLNLLRAAVLAALPLSDRQSGTPEIENLIAGAQSTRLGQHLRSEHEALALAWLLDDARHVHLQLDPSTCALRLHAALDGLTNSRFPENSKLFTFVRAAIDRYERFS